MEVFSSLFSGNVSAITFFRLFFNYCFVVFKLIIREFWWLILLFISAYFYFRLKLRYQKIVKTKKEEVKQWTTLEIKVNLDIYQTPKAMAQVFSGLHALSKGYLTLGILGYEQTVRFFVCVPFGYKYLVESQFYAHYPEIEITEVPDYFGSILPIAPTKNIDFWGSEFVLEKSDYFPIKTYSYFEEVKEEKRIDPLASFIESITILSPREVFLVQIIIKPLGGDKEKKFLESAKEEINKLLGKAPVKKLTFADWVAAFFANLLVAWYKLPEWPETSKPDGSAATVSSIEKEKIEAINNKISQLAFETGIRFLYLAPKEEYNEVKVSSFYAFLQQFASKNLNSFIANKEATTELDKGLFKARRLLFKKLTFYQAARTHSLTSKTCILNMEELATLYHFPMLKVKAPALSRQLYRKSEPPSNLPI
jgi:hypothetical protein